MKERPILFSAPMVRALLNGSKTQTRRAVKPQPEFTEPATVWQHGDGHSGTGWYAHSDEYPEEGALHYRCPYGQPGDRLWVREAHYLTDNGDEEYAVYATDGDAVREHLTSIDRLPSDFPSEVKARHRKLRPSIHMPRWASRITLEVTGVRVERLQDISEADAIAEGIERVTVKTGATVYPIGNQYSHDAVAAYSLLWESINGPGSWDANPWVWVVEFKRVEGTTP